MRLPAENIVVSREAALNDACCCGGRIISGSGSFWSLLSICFSKVRYSRHSILVVFKGN